MKKMRRAPSIAICRKTKTILEFGSLQLYQTIFTDILHIKSLLIVHSGNKKLKHLANILNDIITHHLIGHF